MSTADQGSENLTSLPPPYNLDSNQRSQPPGPGTYTVQVTCNNTGAVWTETLPYELRISDPSALEQTEPVVMITSARHHSTSMPATAEGGSLRLDASNPYSPASPTTGAPREQINNVRAPSRVVQPSTAAMGPPYGIVQPRLSPHEYTALLAGRENSSARPYYYDATGAASRHQPGHPAGALYSDAAYNSVEAGEPAEFVPTHGHVRSTGCENFLAFCFFFCMALAVIAAVVYGFQIYGPDVMGCVFFCVWIFFLLINSRFYPLLPLYLFILYSLATESSSQK